MDKLSFFSLAFVGLLFSVGASAQRRKAAPTKKVVPPANAFTIKGNIPGIKNGTKVSLRSQENDKRIEAECLSQGSTFVLKGTVRGTMLVQLQISDKPANAYKDGEFEEDRGGKLMLESGVYTVSAAQYDSLPRNYDLYSVPMRKEKNVTIDGPKAQQQYQAWANATYAARLKHAELAFLLRNAMFRDRSLGGTDTAEVARLQPLVDAAADDLDKVNANFVAEHPDYAISLLLNATETDKPFAYSADELNRMLATFANNYDKLRYAHFQKMVDNMKKYVKGDMFKDLTLEDAAGKAVNLKDIVKPGKYHFIDFWASWCGPCRAAIPQVKALHQKLGDKLNIISISVDKNKADWTKAMDEEQMPWAQYLVPAAGMKALKDGYFVRYIPTLVVISPDGKILLYTGDPQTAHHFLEEKLKR